MLKTRLRTALKIISLGSLAIVIYIFLHELGHTLVALACGARITQFSIVSAHMSYVGGSFSTTAEFLFHCAGALFPVIIAVIGALFYNRRIENIYYKLLAFFMCVIPFASSIVWILIPCIYSAGQAPAGDDVTKALDVFCANGGSPFVIGIGAVIVFVCGITLMLLKGIPQNFVRSIKALRMRISKSEN